MIAPADMTVLPVISPRRVTVLMRRRRRIDTFIVFLSLGSFGVSYAHSASEKCKLNADHRTPVSNRSGESKPIVMLSEDWDYDRR